MIVIVVLVAPSLPATAAGMFNTKVGIEESFQLGFLIHQAGSETAQERAAAVPMLPYVERLNLPDGSVLTDEDLHGCATTMIIRSTNPKVFVIPNDVDFMQILADPFAFHVPYILVPKPVGFDVVNAVTKQFPSLYANGAGFARLVRSFPASAGLCPPYRLYRVLRHPPGLTEARGPPGGPRCYSSVRSWAPWRTNCSCPWSATWPAGRRAPHLTATGGSTSPPAGSAAAAWPPPGPRWPGRPHSRTPGPTPPEPSARDRRDRVGSRGRYRRVRAIARRTTRLRRGRQAPDPQLRRPRLLPRRQRRACTRRCATAWPPAPASWSPVRGPAARPPAYRGDDVGVHLTVNAEFDLYRWGPITHAPSLLDGDGGFPRTVEDVWDHADLDEVRRECRAQIERAILWGFDVSHLDAHMGTMQIKSEFFDVYLDLAVEFKLPLRLSGADTEGLIGFPFRALAAEAGVVFPDDFVYVPGVGQPPDPPRRHPRASSRASPRPTSTPPWTAPSSRPWRRTGRPGSTTTGCSCTTATCASPSTTPASPSSATGRCATSCGPAPDDRAPRRPRRGRGSELGDGGDLGLELLVLGGVRDGQQRHDLGHVPRHLHLALHEGGVGVELTLLDLEGVGVAGGEGHLGVVELAQLALGDLAVLEDPVVVDVPVGSRR